MATSLEAPPAEAVSPEKRSIYDKIIGLTPGWQEARDKADRDAGMNRELNRDVKDSFAPINGLLEKLVKIDPGILERDYA